MTSGSTTITALPEAAASAEHVPYRWRNLLTLTGVTVVDNTVALSARATPARTRSEKW